MSEDVPAEYLAGLPPKRRLELAQVNDVALAALRQYLASGDAVAFLGAGVSAPLYPLWDGLIGELVRAASGRLSVEEAAACRALARESPEAVVEIVRYTLGAAAYREVLRQVLRVRADSESGQTWTPVQELVCRCAFQAVVTTNYDPGILDARIRVRPGAVSTGFTTWEDELGLDGWRTGEAFGESELPVLFAHGQHNRPDSVVLATADYRRAYEGKLPHVLARLMDSGHLVWIGFSFHDQRINAILREVAMRTGTRAEPGGPPRHIALMAWDPVGEGNDPGILVHRAAIDYGAQAVLYPAPGGDHSALTALLSSLADHRYPPAGDLPVSSPARLAEAPAGGAGVKEAIPVEWVPGPEPVEYFAGRVEELARLARWAADPGVGLIGVTAWGGAGKTALISHWVLEASGPGRRAGVRGVFGWSFYADPSAERWAEVLLQWARRQLGSVAGTGRPATAVLRLLRTTPLLLVLDGLEVVQEGPAGDQFGRLLDGTLREVLSGVCQQHQQGLVVLTSRFPFADLETFDGGTARMLDVPPFTPAEGSALLTAIGGSWLADDRRRALVRAVDGHALATSVLAGVLAARPPLGDLETLERELAEAARTDARVAKVLQFYASRLTESDRYLLAALSLFARPVPAAAVLAVAQHDAFAGRLAGWSEATIRTAVRDRLRGLATWHPDGTISAHPLVRDTFRPLSLGAAEVAAHITLTRSPTDTVATQESALRIVEALELLLEAGCWQAADALYKHDADKGKIFLALPAARMGQRAATAFVATPARREVCAAELGLDRLGFYLNDAGLHAMNAGDLGTGREYLTVTARHMRDTGDIANLSRALANLTECLTNLGDTSSAREAGEESLASARSLDGNELVLNSQAYLGVLAGLTGETIAADSRFAAAERIAFSSPARYRFLHRGDGIVWAEHLARTGRRLPARALINRIMEISRSERRMPWVAGCDRLLGHLALGAGDAAAASKHLEAAASYFRDGDYLTELTPTLADLAEAARAAGDLDAADRHATEAVAIAAPRGLVLAQSAALAARARIRAAQFTSTANRDLLYKGRDAADAALRLAIRHDLAWHELDALRAHAILDQAEHADHEWVAQAEALHARLVPPGLDSDPLATIEQFGGTRQASWQIMGGWPGSR